MKKLKLSPGRIIALGFLSVILVGSLLLSLPQAHSGDVPVTYLDALFSSTSAVCVTGLVTVDTGAAYSGFGQAVIAVLLQIGGLGITSLGAGLVALMGGKLSQRENNLVKEALNYPTWNGVGPLIRAVLILDFSIEAVGAALSYVTFSRDFPAGRAVWLSVFHSIAAFNNGGFDVLGNGDSIGCYAEDPWFNLVTCTLILLGGLGFFVIRELLRRANDRLHRWKLRRCSLHTKVVLMMTAILTVGGAVLLKLTEGFSWGSAFFASITARSAGFSMIPASAFTTAGLLILCVLMFIGANPGSTGGGMKTTTFYALVKSLIAYSTGREARSFGRKLKDDTLHRAFIIISLGLTWSLAAAILLAALEPELPLHDVLFEAVACLSTAGISTGITPTLSVPSKLILMLTMYVGRLGPLTIATLWTVPAPSGVSRPEEDLPIG